MTKSDLIEQLAASRMHMPAKDVEAAIKEILEQMASTLQNGDRIEIRGFGSFSLHYRAPRVGRNPKTGEEIPITARRVVTFRAGQKFRQRVEQEQQNDQ